MLKQIIAVLCLLPALCAYAVEAPVQNNVQTPAPKPRPLYQIEVIVFTYTAIPNRINAELWSARPMAQHFSNAIELTAATPHVMNQTFQLLPRARWQLAHELYSLEHSDNYRVVAHFAWLQPEPPNTQTTVVHLQGGRVFLASSGEAVTDPDIIKTRPVFYQLDGTISLYQDRYWQVTTNLWFTESAKMLSDKVIYKELDPDSELVSFNLEQMRRMRVNELNYFDNPLLGMLIKIVPVKD